MKVKLRELFESNFLDDKIKLGIGTPMSQMRNGLLGQNSSNSNSTSNNSNNNSEDRQRINKANQELLGNSKGVFAGTKESLGMLKNQERNTALSSLNKTKSLNENLSLNEKLIKNNTTKNMVDHSSDTKHKITTERPDNNNVNKISGNNIYDEKANQSSAFLTRGIKPYGKWTKPTNENPEGYPTPAMHNNHER